MSKVFIIAEAGVNHNGDVGLAKEMVDAAAEAGADAVKFQTFKAEDIAIASAPKAKYQARGASRDKTQFQILKRLELSEGAHLELIGYCLKKEITFLSSAFDLKGIDMLRRLGLDIFKIPSGEITNLPYLRKIGGLNKRILLSTGMSDLNEVREALDILVSAGTPKEKMTVLHCNSEYPTPFEDVNLLAMLNIKRAFGVDVGYSDHTQGIEVSIAAVALGADVIEKHFTLSKDMEGPDHKASLEPGELKAMISAIRNIEKSLGKKKKAVSPSEAENRLVVRKSIVAARDIRSGKCLEEEDIAAKRPGNGVSPMRWDEVLGSEAKKDFKKDEAIKL